MPSFLTLGDNKILINFLGITAYVWGRELGAGEFTIHLSPWESGILFLSLVQYVSALVTGHEGGSKGCKRLVRDTIFFSVAEAFDVDSTLDFDLDHIAGVGGLPPDVTSGIFWP